MKVPEGFVVVDGVVVVLVVVDGVVVVVVVDGVVLVVVVDGVVDVVARNNLKNKINAINNHNYSIGKTRTCFARSSICCHTGVDHWVKNRSTRAGLVQSIIKH